MGNLFDIAKIDRMKNTYLVRQERIKRQGSPYYTWVVPVTATTATSVISVESQFREARKYEPLDWIEISNNDVQDLTLTINGGDRFPVPAGTIRTISNKALWHIAITNDGGANTVLNKIIVTLQKQALTIDKWARKQS